MKKKYIAWILGVCAVLVASIGATAASRYSESHARLRENISEKDLGVTAEKNDADQESEVNVMPGQESHLGYYVKNSGGSAADSADSYDIYAKVEIFYSFSKDKEEIINNEDLPVVSFFLQDQDSDHELGEYIRDYRDSRTIGDWIVAYYDEQEIVMYYTRPISYQDTSSEFLSYVKFNENMGNEYAGCDFNLETRVTAVQTDSGRSAIAAEWGLYPEINSQGIITAISETR